MAGFEPVSSLSPPTDSCRGSAPNGVGPGNPSKVAGFGSSEPEGALAGFEAACNDSMAFATEPRSTPSCRAIARRDIPAECNCNIA